MFMVALGLPAAPRTCAGSACRCSPLAAATGWARIYRGRRRQHRRHRGRDAQVGAAPRLHGRAAVAQFRQGGRRSPPACGRRAASRASFRAWTPTCSIPPRCWIDMLAHWRDGADVVYAVSPTAPRRGPVKRWGSRAFYRLINAFERFEVPADAGDFRLMDRAWSTPCWPARAQPLHEGPVRLGRLQGRGAALPARAARRTGAATSTAATCWACRSTA
jgi:hypothetical protein